MLYSQYKADEVETAVELFFEKKIFTAVKVFDIW